jgi:TolB-like protein
MKKVTVFLTLFLMVACALFAQKKESLAVFAFTGGNVSDGEAIASSLTRQAVLRNAFNKTTLINRNTIAAMNFEQRFQRNSGLTDADTIFELGKQLNASHVIAGYITKLGDRNLVIVSIMDIESLQQIAGDYRAYRTIDEIDALIPDMAKKLAGAVPGNTSALPGLSVPPFNISSGVNQNDAMVLAQILSCDLANSGKYAVLPRTDSIEKVLEEQKRQRSGVTDQERIKRLGAGRNAKYVLSGSVQRLGSLNKFGVDILDILDGSFIDGYEEQYTSLSQGFELIPKLAMQVAGGGAVSQSDQSTETQKTEQTEKASRKTREPRERNSETDNAAKLWTLGVSAGSAFAAPLVIGTVHGTIAPIRNAFLEVGFDFGLISGDSDVNYYSMYPFAHVAFFLPFPQSGGWYAGAGGGFMIARYTFPEGDYSANIFAADFITGVNILNMIDISYTLRTNFSGASNKLSVGYTYRFK